MPTPYNVGCNGCKSELNITTRELDRDGDLLVEVDPCEVCLQAKREEVEEEMEG